MREIRETTHVRHEENIGECERGQENRQRQEM